ncbi:MAG: lysine--tRNA ligase, partial [Lachnospiraceae bacterium]|nr:lysine--tRNA ligase [Lachnospiraceae bacterium]
MAQQEKDLNQLLKVRREKLSALQENGQDPFLITKYDATIHSNEIREQFEALEFVPEKDEDGKAKLVPLEEIPKEKIVSIAGRMMFKRVMGKASFANLRDRNGDIQIYITRNDLGDEAYAAFKKYDVGDILGVKGFVFKTKTGEISVHAKEVTLLTKSLQILPEKFHGLTDTDLRYRQRYVDLTMNTEVRETFFKRSQILYEIRQFLNGRGFMEVETPILVS